MSEVSIKAMFDDLLHDEAIGGLRSGGDFLRSLKDYFDKNGHLTEKQEAALRRMYRNHMGA